MKMYINGEAVETAKKAQTLSAEIGKPIVEARAEIGNIPIAFKASSGKEWPILCEKLQTVDMQTNGLNQLVADGIGAVRNSYTVFHDACLLSDRSKCNFEKNKQDTHLYSIHLSIFYQLDFPSLKAL